MQSFKILVIRMLKELSENLSSIKKIQSETKDSWTEIKNNLQGNNSRVDEAENQINDLEHKEAKKPIRTAKRKKNTKKWGRISSLWDKFNRVQHLPHRGAKGRRERARNWKSIWQNSERKLPLFGEGNRHASPGSTESPNHDACKQAHSKTHHN